MIFIRRNKDPHGWLGNMSRYPLTHKGKEYRTAEALFQSMRFEDEEIKEAIRAEKSPMGGKFVAKRHVESMTVERCSEEDLNNMRVVLRLKIEQHPELATELLATGEEKIVEDCTKRPRRSSVFWGAALQGEEWVGENWLGVLWMELRTELALPESWVCACNQHWVKEVRGSKGNFYTVQWAHRPDGPSQYDYTCTCKAYEFGGGKHCKHIRAVDPQRCDWTERYDGGEVTRDESDEPRCPKCGGPAVAVKEAV